MVDRLSRALAWVFAPLLAHRRTLLMMNLVYFGTIVVGIAYTLVDTTAQKTLVLGVQQALSPTGHLGPVAEAYRGGQIGSAIVLTLLVNLLAGSVLTVTLFSLVLPFGLVIGVLRAFTWGVLGSPFGGIFTWGFLPHVVTGIIEGEAYVVAMVGVWVWWWPVLTTPGRRWQMWREGLRRQGRIYVAVAFLLVVAAIYEVLELVYLLPRLVLRP